VCRFSFFLLIALVEELWMYVSREVRLVQHTATDTVPHNVNQSVTNNRSRVS
jgi:hypothetical protein